MTRESDALAAITREVNEAVSRVAELADTVREAAVGRAGSDDPELYIDDPAYSAVLDVFSLLLKAQDAACRLPAGEAGHRHGCVLPECAVRGPHLHACRCGARYGP